MSYTISGNIIAAVGENIVTVEFMKTLISSNKWLCPLKYSY